jgi:hypothetical protein
MEHEAMIEEQIRRAMQDGKLDNLLGEGKPIRWDENPNEKPEFSYNLDAPADAFQIGPVGAERVIQAITRE